MKNMVSKVEDRLVTLFKPLPHFPMKVSAWLRDNAWWLVLIGVVLSVTAIIYMLGVLMGAAYVAQPYLSAAAAYGYTVTINPMVIVASWISVLSLVAVLIIEAMAISPLKRKLKKGWDLLLLASLVATATSLVAGLLNLDIAGVVMTVVAGAIGLYVLFEIRAAYTAKTGAKEATAKPEFQAPKPDARV